MSHQHFFESLPICLLQLDASGKCTYANAHLLSALQARFSDLEAHKWQDIFTQADLAKILEYIQHATASTPHLILEAEINFANIARWTQIRASRQVDPDGTVLLFVDISETKNQAGLLYENEEKFRGAFENVSAGMAIVSLDGILLKVNTTLCKMLGYNREQIEGKKFQSLTHPDDIIADEENVQKILTGQITHYQIEKRYLHKDD